KNEGPCSPGQEPSGIQADRLLHMCAQLPETHSLLCVSSCGPRGLNGQIGLTHPTAKGPLAQMIQPAKLALEDGTVFAGSSIGADGEVDGEVCFNTSMTGYQEILTDPSYRGQIVTMTYPQIGNYGVNQVDYESSKPHLAGFVVREHSRIESNFRSENSLSEFLKKWGVVAIESIDTRALVRRIRSQGAMRGVLSTVDLDDESLVAKAKGSPGL